MDNLSNIIDGLINLKHTKDPLYQKYKPVSAEDFFKTSLYTGFYDEIYDFWVQELSDFCTGGYNELILQILEVVCSKQGSL